VLLIIEALELEQLIAVERLLTILTCLVASTGAVPAMKSEATAIFAPQDGRWKITVSFDGRRFCVSKFRH